MSPSINARRSEAESSLDFVAFRAVPTTLYPRARNARVTPAPMPCDAPVTITVLRLLSMSMILQDVETRVIQVHEIADELGNAVGSRIEREVTRVENVDFGVGHVVAIGFGFRKLEGEVVLPPEDEQPRLLLAHPRLPLRIVVDVRAVVVEEIALDVGLPGLAEKGELVGPEIRVVAFHVGVVSDMTGARRRER